MVHGALSIKLRCASWQQLATIYKRDLSRGTMFLKAAQPPPVGTVVRIDLTLPSSSVVVLNGTVEHHVSDPRRGIGVELKLAPIPTGSIWLIETALSSEQRVATPSSGVPQVAAPAASGPVAALGEGEDVAAAEAELIRALETEVESLKRLNPFLVLGVGYEASDDDVRAAFGELTKRYHPDRFARYEAAELRSVAAEIFILIRDAYRKISDSQSRVQVLASLGRGPVPRAVPIPRPAAARPGVPVAIPPRDAKSGPIPAIRIGDPKSGPVRIPTGQQARLQRPGDAVAVPPAAAEPVQPARGAPAQSALDDAAAVDAVVDDGRYDEALSSYRQLARKHPQERVFRAGIELCEGLLALVQRDRLEAAQRFEAALEIDPSNERAARELAEMRRQATNERRGLLSRLMGKKEP
jgi:tetratricopeptide (TPR) repeat protein